MKKNKVIVALSTPQGIGALSVIRLSGDDVNKIFEKTVLEKEKFKNEEERKIRRYTFIDLENNPVDEITAIKYKGPMSFTGENMIEIISHGGRYTTKKIIQVLKNRGSEIAERGEFTKRAFLNGKMSLLKAESINSIIESNNERELKTAINFYRQKSETIIEEIEEQIKEELSDIEAVIEFSEDEQNEIKEAKTDKISKIIRKIEKEIYIRDRIENRRNEKQIVIIGPTNAGKSSIYNHIIGYRRAIVSEIEGTTRDSISEIIKINGIKCKFIDTAGMRITNDEIEKEGQKKTEEIIKTADKIIWVTDISENIKKDEENKYIENRDKISLIIINKIDKLKNREKENFYKNEKKEILELSVTKEKNLDKVVSWLEKEIGKEINDSEESTIILNERHKKTVLEINKALKKAKKNWKRKEIAAEYLYEALGEIEKITGKNNPETIINSIFKKFCVGK